MLLKVYNLFPIHNYANYMVMSANSPTRGLYKQLMILYDCQY